MSNNTRSKAILKILSGKTRSANEERKQLRRAAVIYKHGEHANINAILAAENAAMLANARNAKSYKANNNHKSKSKHNNKPNHNNKPKHNNKANNNTKKAPKKWAKVETKPFRR
jgi:hypothetical protein